MSISEETHNELPKLLSAEEVAAWLNVGVNWVYAKAVAREIPSLMIARQRKFVSSDLETWLEQRKRAA